MGAPGKSRCNGTPGPSFRLSGKLDQSNAREASPKSSRKANPKATRRATPRTSRRRRIRDPEEGGRGEVPKAVREPGSSSNAVQLGAQPRNHRRCPHRRGWRSRSRPDPAAPSKKRARPSPMPARVQLRPGTESAPNTAAGAVATVVTEAAGENFLPPLVDGDRSPRRSGRMKIGPAIRPARERPECPQSGEEGERLGKT